MKGYRFKYIYGPVSSWRLGCSLGIDLLSQRKKICNFDCIYCQLGRTLGYTKQRKLFVPIGKLVRELNSLPSIKIDYISLSGRGEPTLAVNLGQTIKAIKKLRNEPTAVLTNSSLIDNAELRKELSLADFVIVKLDAPSDELLQIINRPSKGIKFAKILKGIKNFRASYKGRLALQIMFVKENKDKAKDLAYLAQGLKVDEVQINTPLRPCRVTPLSEEEIFKIKQHFSKMKTVCVYEVKPKEAIPINKKDLLKRRSILR